MKLLDIVYLLLYHLWLPVRSKITKGRRMRLESLWMLRGLYAGVRELGVNVKLGGWAMGMPMLFVLNELITKHRGLGILEFGSGQSTKFIMAHNDGGRGVISKHVVKWSDSVGHV